MYKKITEHNSLIPHFIHLAIHLRLAYTCKYGRIIVNSMKKFSLNSVCTNLNKSIYFCVRNTSPFKALKDYDGKNAASCKSYKDISLKQSCKPNSKIIHFVIKTSITMLYSYQFLLVCSNLHSLGRL